MPAGVCSVRWDNPITKNLTGLINGRGGIGAPRDLVINERVQVATTAVMASNDVVAHGQRTPGYNGVLATNRIGNIGKFGAWMPTNVAAFSVAACFDLLAFGTGIIVGDAADRWAIYSSGGWYAYIATSSTTWFFADAANYLKVGRRHVLGMTYDGAFLRCYVDGRPMTAQAAVGNTTITYDPIFARIQFAGGFDQVGAAHALLWAGIWNRVLSKEEMRSLYEEKFQLLATTPSRLWFPVIAPNVTIPSLTLASVFNIGNTYATPRVTITV